MKCREIAYTIVLSTLLCQARGEIVTAQGNCGLTTCPIGKYLRDCVVNGAAGTCTPCEGLQIGKYFTTSGGITPNGCQMADCIGANMFCESYSSSAVPTTYSQGCSIAFCPGSGQRGYQWATGIPPYTCAVADCNNALPDEWYNGAGGDCSRQTSTSCPVVKCTNAGLNEYYSGEGGTTARDYPGSCPVQNCTNALPSQYYTGGGGLNSTSCKVGSCTNALPNQYYSGLGGALAPKIINTCPVSVCQAGSYLSAPGAVTCTNCIAGKFSGAVGATSETTCIDCASAKYSASGASECVYCTDCGPGRYQISACNPNTNTVCADCSDLSYSLGGHNLECISCSTTMTKRIGHYTASCGRNSRGMEQQCSVTHF